MANRISMIFLWLLQCPALYAAVSSQQQSTCSSESKVKPKAGRSLLQAGATNGKLAGVQEEKWMFSPCPDPAPVPCPPCPTPSPPPKAGRSLLQAGAKKGKQAGVQEEKWMFGPCMHPAPVRCPPCPTPSPPPPEYQPHKPDDDSWLLLQTMLPNNPVAKRDAPAVQKEVRLSLLVKAHDADDSTTMRRAESLKSVLGADFNGKINEVLLESSPALRPMVGRGPIKVVDRGDGYHVVTDGNGRIQAMKLAFVDHSAVNVAVDEIQLEDAEKKEFFQKMAMLRAAADDQAIRKGFVEPKHLAADDLSP